jgi:hypothetical protein
VALGLSDEVEEGDFHRVIGLGELDAPLEAEGLPLEGVASDEELGDRPLDLQRGALVGRARRPAAEALVGLDADEHGVALQDRPLAVVEGQLERLRQRTAHQEGVDAGDLHEGSILC